MQKVLKVHPDDNLIVALQDLTAGDQVSLDGETFILVSPTSAKHKFAAVQLNQGDAVVMYGVLVGRAMQPIQRGEVITTFNLKHAASTPVIRESDYQWTPPRVDRFANRTFNGFHRSDGKVGIANYWIIIPLVFCENRNIDMLRELLVEKLGYHKPKSFGLDVDKLVADLLGKSKKDYNQILLKYPNIDSADLVISPFWKMSLPDKTRDIKVIVNYPK